MATPQQFCTFTVDGAFFGVDVLRVQEVLRFHEMTPVPLAPPAVSGLINLRGQIVTAVDLRRRLGLAPRAEDEQPMNVVVRAEDGAVSLLVDAIEDVLEVDEAGFEPPPATIEPAAGEVIAGVYKLQDRLLLILDTEKAVDVSRIASTERPAN